ncbi:DeoR family transcriptional regulator [Phaeobacter sp. HF9A]|uniref:DeoR family transcriptional regulator n=1 Tax=Phaeobacter sp. HF9A TaxID=2721561 RepID=UPI001430F675|nr:DeoR family transcriptional regulator [Phaeobacter sp. HF9A]NIZ12560.1 DeoR family transcriptional regulator [Phaeobacter sp. HF9A]
MRQPEHRGTPATRKEARLLLLKDTVERNGSIHIRDAAELLDVSEMTIRRDMREAPETFQFLGGHIVLSQEAQRRAPYELAQAAELNEAAKRAACAACVPLLMPEETLFVDCGTTLPHLIDLIPDDMELTIICYALNIADMVVRKPNLQLVLLGGVYHAPTASFYPAQDDATLDAYAINHAFMSAAGVEESLGVTCTTFREAGLKQTAMARAQNRILVADQSKFGVVNPASFARLSDFDRIATEAGLQPAPAD